MVEKEEIGEAIETGTNLIGYIVSFSLCWCLLLKKQKRARRFERKILRKKRS